MPHIKVNVGSQSFGDVRLRMILLGISDLSARLAHLELMIVPHFKQYIADEVESKTSKVLIACDLEIGCQALDLCIGDCDELLADDVDKRKHQRTIAAVKKAEQVQYRHSGK